MCLSRVRIQCHPCCGVGLIPGPRTSAGTTRKKEGRKEGKKGKKERRKEGREKRKANSCLKLLDGGGVFSVFLFVCLFVFAF